MADLISDHCAVHCRIAMRKPPFRRELKTYRKMKAINLTSFSTDIENSDLYSSQERSLEESVTQYNDVLGDLLEKHAPLKTKWLTIRPAAPWVNDDILSARKERRRMERRWRLLDADYVRREKRHFQVLLHCSGTICHLPCVPQTPSVLSRSN